MTTTSAAARPSISSLYVLKAIGAFLVVACHTPFLWDVKEWSDPLRTMAVPLFFMISGYLLYAPEVEISEARALKMIKKLIPIILIVNLINYLWVLPNHGNVIDSWDKLMRLILLGGTISGHLWYLTALLEGMLLLYALLRWFRGWGISLLPLLLVLNLLVGRYHDALFSFDVSIALYSVICYGLPFLALGYLIGRYRERLSGLHWQWISLALLVLSYLEYILFIGLESSGLGIYLMTAPLATSLMMLALTHPTFGAGGVLERIGLHHSGNIYYFHIMMATACIKLLGLLGLGGLYDPLGAVWAYVLTLLFSVVLRAVQSRLGLKIL